MAPEAVTSVNTTQVPSFHFAETISAIPVVASALGVARQVYDTIKTRYEVIGKVESEVVDHLVPRIVNSAVIVTPQSAQAIISSGLSQLDSYACSGLGLLEKMTTEIIGSGKKLVDERIVVPVDNIIEKALEFSEAKVDQLLPAKEAVAAENGYSSSPAAKNRKLVRAQKLGVEVCKYLVQKAITQSEAIRKVIPAGMQKCISADVIRVATTKAKNQLVWLKEVVEGIIVKVVHRRDSDLHKKTINLKAGFAQAINKTEKAIDPYLKKLLDTLNASVAYFESYMQSLSTLLSSRS